MISLLAAGICTPLGPADVAGAAIAAGLSRARHLDHGPILGIGDDAHPAAGHAVCTEGGATGRHERLLALAWAELLAGGAPPRPDAVLLATAGPDPRRWPPGDEPDPLTGTACCGQTVRVLGGGHIAPAAALAEAERLIAAGARQVLIGAVETRIDPVSLAWLAGDDRLHGPETADGLTPGEAAAWWLLGPAGMTGALAQVRGRQAASDGDRSPAAIATRWRSLGMDDAAACDWIDLTGEAWRARAWGTLLPHLPERPHLAHPDHWGDLGAAGALCAATCLIAGGGSAWSLAEDGAVGCIAVNAAKTEAFSP